MPTYVYKFVDSGETIEIQQSFHDDALTEAVHPVSGKVLPVKKVFLPVGVTFRGDGFYKTDSRASKAKSKSTSDSKSDSSNASSTGDGGSGTASTSGDSGASAGTAGKPAATSSSSSPSD